MKKGMRRRRGKKRKKKIRRGSVRNLECVWLWEWVGHGKKN